MKSDLLSFNLWEEEGFESKRASLVSSRKHISCILGSMKYSPKNDRV